MKIITQPQRQIYNQNNCYIFSQTNFTGKSVEINSSEEHKYSFFKNWFKQIFNRYLDKLFNLSGNTKIFTDERHVPKGSINISFPQKEIMSIDYLEVNEQLRRRPQESGKVIIDIVKHILNTGNKKSVKEITCIPMDEEQEKLYQKFGFKTKTSYLMMTTFSNFKQKASKILDLLNTNPRFFQK